MNNFRLASKYSHSRLLYIAIVPLFFSLSCIEVQKNSLRSKDTKNTSTHMAKVETVFQQHFALLDSVLTGQYRGKKYPLEKLQATIDFLESLTGIPSKADGTDIGRIEVEQEDVTNWKNWYIDNKQKLFWNIKEKRIMISKSEN